MYGVSQGMGDVVVEWKSISENMALGMQGAMEQMVEEACFAASFQTFARDRWRGFWVERDGVALNGGQKLQLTIARGEFDRPRTWYAP
jgi:ABC-type bacteriocin/lantibiotic exporter with double-glycine peptidase domain